MKNPFWAHFLISLFSIFSLASCGDIPGAGRQTDTESFSFGGALYVTNKGDGSLLVFDPPTINTSAKATFTPRVVEGNVLPSRRFPEAVAAPSGIFLDRTNNTLYVANTGQNAISIYENASTLRAPVSATRVISGSNTLLDHPFGVTFDATHNRLFVANRDSNSVVVFDTTCTSTLAGNIAPCRRLIISGQTPPSFPRAVAIDTQRNLLYVSTTGNDSILIYADAGNIGGSPSGCVTDLSACTDVPDRVISPHSGTEDASKLELPFGIFIDILNDRLYVANSGLNTPGILIYDSASTLDSQNASTPEDGIVPERVITGLNTQLTVPSGIDVDVAAGQVFVVNNNSPNNVNLSSGNNTESPSLIVFNNIDSVCTSTMHLCNISPDKRIGGDATPDANPTMASPLGLAIDPTRNIIYIADAGANNILLFSLDGDLGPTKINAGGSDNESQTVFPFAVTSLEHPSGFFYDADIDRLYVSNFGSFGFGNNSAATIPVLVYDKFSTIHFNNTKPSWTIAADSNFDNMRGFHIDKERGYLLVLSNATLSPKFSIYCIPKSDGKFNVKCTNPATLWNSFPTNDATVSEGTSLTPPTPFKEFTADLTTGVSNGPRAMAVDDANGHVYIADKLANSIFVYDLTLNPPDLARTITSASFDQPHGLAIDSTRDILYVSNVGDNTLLSFENVSAKDGNIVPDRTVTTLTLAEEDKLKTPILLSIDTKENELFVISAVQNSIFIYGNANTLNGEKSPDRKITGSNTLLDFTPPQIPFNNIGALLVAHRNETQTLFVGQPESPLCDKGAPINCPTGALLVFSVKGKVAPSWIWAGGVGLFITPTGIGVDTTRDILYVVNQATNTLSRLKDASKVDVTLDPSTGKTDLSNIQLNHPAGLFIDIAQNRLYISNDGAILGFDDPDTLSDGATPSLALSDPQLSNPRGITVDTTRKRLYVANTGNNSVAVFTVNGTATLDAAISGPNTKLNKPIDVAVDATRDLLYVLNSGATEILIFEGASTLSGNIAPTRVIRGGDLDTNNVTGATNGNNFMVSPSALFVDPTLDLLYLSDQGAHAVFIFPNASTAAGQAEHKTLSGDNTGLNSPSALFVDTTGSF